MIYLGSRDSNDYFYEPISNYIYYVDISNRRDIAWSSKWQHYIDSMVECFSDSDNQLTFHVPAKRIQLTFDDVDDDYKEEYVYRKFDSIIEQLIFEKL